MSLEAVLFDMDGTLVDSIPAWHKTFNQVLELQGSKPVSYEYFCSDILGESTEKDIERFFPNLTPQGLVELYDQFFPQNISSVRPFPQTATVLDFLKSKGQKLGLVTNTPHVLMELTLKTTGLSFNFDSILGGDDVPRGKPWPDIIHRTCELLNVAEETTIMVGDTKADIVAAANAKVKSVGINVDGDWRINSIGELPHLFEKINLI
jgi:HAD superfamily hydrolase (TIGR01549 family)